MENPLTSPMTELEAVNGMLASIGTAPLNTLDVAGIRDASIAQFSLNTVNREVLSKGWNFNTDEEWPLAPDGDGYIAIPETALVVDPSDPTHNYVERYLDGTRRLYNKAERSFTFAKPVECDIVWAFPFDEVPQTARTYIATRAARIFQSQVIGSDILFKFTELHEREAKATMAAREIKSKDANLFRSPSEENLTIFRRRSNPIR